MNNEPSSGSVVPVGCEHVKDSWPKCYGYIRGTNPPEEQKLLMRAAMVNHCEENELRLARIFHDWEVTQNQVDYPGLRHTIEHAAHPDTHTLLLADLDFYDNPSHVLAVLAGTITQTCPGSRSSVSWMSGCLRSCSGSEGGANCRRLRGS